VREALAGSDLTHVRSATTELESAAQRIGQEVYSQAGATPGGGPSSSAAGPAAEGESGTVEGEYREI